MEIVMKCAYCGCEEILTEEDYNELLACGGPVCADCLEYKGKRLVKMERVDEEDCSPLDPAWHLKKILTPVMRIRS